METATNKKIGIWLDHEKAHFIDAGKHVLYTVYSGEESQPRYPGEHGDGAKLGNNRSTNNENQKHKRQQNILSQYYHDIANRLNDYDEVYLFGPTTAKDELRNHLKADKHSAYKTIHVQHADQLTENQMVAKVKQFFNL